MDLPETWTTDVVRANGVDLRYYRTGDGPPLVMAHGFYDNGRCWIPLADAFEGIRCPTLVLKSDADPERRARDLDVAAAFPDGRLVHVPGADHYVFQTQYEAACAELRTFLRRL